MHRVPLGKSHSPLVRLSGSMSGGSKTSGLARMAGSLPAIFSNLQYSDYLDSMLNLWRGGARASRSAAVATETLVLH